MSRRRPGGAVLVGLFLAASAVAQPSAPDTVWVQPEVEPAVVSIGEPVDVRVRLVAPGAQVELIGPPAPMSAGDLDILLSQPVPAGGDSLAWDLRVALFRPGDHTLETIPFVLDTPEGSRPLRLVPYRITVESVLSDSAGASDLRDIHATSPDSLRERRESKEARRPGMSAAQTDLWTRGVSNHMLYHMVMARREVLVQLEDDLVARLDELAKRAGVSRSELIRRGATAVLDADELGRKDRELVDAYRKTPPDPVLLKASIRLAAENTPEW